MTDIAKLIAEASEIIASGVHDDVPSDEIAKQVVELALSRLQALTGPDREVDAEIALENGWTRTEFGNWQSPSGGYWSGPPRYTESLDAALTLVPDGASWELGTYITTGAYRSYVLTDEQGFSGYGHTPAITLLIAIRKAKEEAKS